MMHILTLVRVPELNGTDGLGILFQDGSDEDFAALHLSLPWYSAGWAPFAMGLCTVLAIGDVSVCYELLAVLL